ncbi:MAG: hypothetical protein NC548_35385 [Lachnospiraceae bacterium]|nr:hypothetical protein [Lachnospiraceae bacterium]
MADVVKLDKLLHAQEVLKDSMSLIEMLQTASMKDPNLHDIIQKVWDRDTGSGLHQIKMDLFEYDRLLSGFIRSIEVNWPPTATKE